MNYLYNENRKIQIQATSADGKFIYINSKKKHDLSYASGSLILGHSSNVFKKSLNQIKKIGSNYSFINKYVIYFSQLLKKIFPEFSKFIMCATGTEANMKALRIARAITNKNKVAMVAGSWHGSVDELLYSSFDSKSKKKKVLSAGLNNRNNTIVIPYNNFSETKKILNKNKKNLALVIIEPIQQALPFEENENYIKDLLVFCKKNNILICFDEMITGLRIREFSVYKKLKVVPDLITFGKIFGGGAPIGIIGISKKIEKKLNKKSIFFGGTYSLNPLTMILGTNTINYILKNKKKIYDKLKKNSKYLVENINKMLKINKIDIKLIHYDSIIRILFSAKDIKNKIQKDNVENEKKLKIDAFKNFILKKRIFLSKNGAIFLSVQNNKSDIDYIIKMFSIGFKKFFL